MKIALLNLQYDNNYGGNLQRYALMTILQRMGHDVTHLNLRFKFYPDNKLKYLKILFWRIYDRVIHGRRTPIFQEFYQRKNYYRDCQNTESFYNKYIKHTKIIESKKKLSKFQKFDVFIVGSDQVWRKKFTQMHGVESFFFDFVKDSTKRIIAYGASLGSSESELSKEDIEKLTPFYKRFSNVSVRELSALHLLDEYNWSNPQPTLVLDPTLLLNKKDYIDIINNNKTSNCPGNLFCYILDLNNGIEAQINHIAQTKNLCPFFSSLKQNCISVPQWLRAFNDSKFIITDSYHGVLFSIIFQKPFYFFQNQFRGNARFENLQQIFNIQANQEISNFSCINKELKKQKNHSFLFLSNALQ